MGRSQELSEFQRGMVIGCHLCNVPSRQISSLLSIPQSTVSGIITKWKRLGTTATQPRSGRPRKMTKRVQRMVRHIVQRDCHLSPEAIAIDLKTEYGLKISSRTVRRELPGVFFRMNKCDSEKMVENKDASDPDSPKPCEETSKEG